MNKTNQDKIWELAASKIHDEADRAEENELEEMIQQDNHAKVYRSVNEMHEKLKETTAAPPQFRLSFPGKNNTVFQKETNPAVPEYFKIRCHYIAGISGGNTYKLPVEACGKNPCCL